MTIPKVSLHCILKTFLFSCDDMFMSITMHVYYYVIKNCFLFLDSTVVYTPNVVYSTVVYTPNPQMILCCS